MAALADSRAGRRSAKMLERVESAAAEVAPGAAAAAAAAVSGVEVKA